MEEALLEAKAAFSKGEVPVGAVAVHEGKLLAGAHNRVEEHGDATAHAEMLVLQQAADVLGNWRLQEVDIFVTLEPCPMCAGAMILSRVRAVYFGSYDKRMGACGSCFNLMGGVGLPHEVEVNAGVLSEQSEKLLVQFFKKLRQGPVEK